VSGLALGDVVPAIATLEAHEVEVILEGDHAQGLPIEELPAYLLIGEWMLDGQLIPPITARLAAAILESEPLRTIHLSQLAPDLVRSPRYIDRSTVRQESATKLAADGITRWQSLKVSPAEASDRWGRETALEVTAAALREAAHQMLALGAFPPTRAIDVKSSLAVIADWAVGELGLENLGDALEAARGDVHAPTEVRRGLAVLERTELTPLTTGSEVGYDLRQAMRRLLATGDRSKIVLERRVYGGKDKQTLDQLGKTLGVTRERIRQIEGHLVKQIKECLQAKEFEVVHRAAARLRDDIGACRRLNAVPDLAAWALGQRAAPSPEDALHARVLFTLAGPWREHAEWLLHDASASVVPRTREAFEERLVEGPITEDEAFEILAAHEIPEEDRPDWLAIVCRCRIIDGFVLHWRGSMADKAAAILALRGEPLTGDELMEALGPGTNPRSFINQIQADARFMRRGLKLYGLRHWGGEEYTTIKEEIEQEIERQGGVATIDHLISTLCEQFGVSESSVRAYAVSPPFVRTSDGRVTLGAGEASYVRRPIEDCRGCFRVGPHWALRVIVDAELLRGSGRPVSVGVPQLLGMRPGEARHVTTPMGDLLVRYSRQGTIGSLRKTALQLGCSEGDRLFVIFAGEAIDFLSIPAAELRGVDGVERLARELGAEREADPVSAIAYALGLPSDEYRLSAVRRRLVARKEEDLLALIGDIDDPEPDDDVLSQLIRLGE
jgi:hypothetical protein